MKEIITIRIDLTTAQTTLNLDGFEGDACLSAVAEIKEAMGGEEEFTPKPELRRNQTHVQNQKHNRIGG
ncbi:hypothetical protein H6G00_01710 [Leptolyngbya sp. FACHB-541]|uniref:hypothetical protein n=1 Tax=Leptolyngbya sp. FACHB-541 TaxID=2692810 RepID=UPI001689DC5D|nr:hypothetical protein [Leptolyngbya sp. FACHB-541]MBD1995347.1 hypothetical protein [Leptolyngbya sp. FACHB-541]